MKKHTRILSLLLAMIMVFSLLPVSAFAAEAATPEVVSQQLNLGDDLSIHFHIIAEANTVVNATVSGETTQYDLSKITPDRNDQYTITVELAAAQMTSDITLDFVQEGVSVLQKTYSVRDYADAILEGDFNARTKKMIRWMLHYGAAAQQYFGVNTENLANAGYELTEAAALPNEYTEMAMEGSIEGVRFYGASLVFESKIAVRYYFTANSIENVTFSANGVTYKAEQKNGMYYVEVPGINPQNYSDSILLSAVKGEETLSVSYSPLNYIIRMSEKGSDSLKMLLNALYGYHEAAVDYLTNTGFFGDADGCYTTSHLDLTADTGANTGTVTVSEDGIAFGYIDSFCAENFYFEAKFHVNGILETENWPKFGLIIESGNIREYFYVDMTTDLSASVVGRMTNTGGIDDWANAKSVPVNHMAFSGEGENVILGILKQGKRLHLFVDGAYAMSSVCSFDGSAVAGIFSFNTGLTVTEYDTYTTDATLEALKALVPEGELSKGESFGYAVGDGVTYGTTSEVDLSTDQGTEPTIRFYGSAPRYAYLNDVYTDKFCFETEINVESVLNNDPWPKFGLMVNGNSEMVKFFVDMTPAMTATYVGVVYQPTGGGDDWAGSKSCEVPDMAFTGSDTVKLKLIRDGRAYFFYVNDVLVLQDDFGFKSERGAVGIFSFNTALTASNYSVSVGVAADNAVESAKSLDLTCNWFANNNGVYTLATDSDAQHKVDDLTRGGHVLRENFYCVGGKLTLTDAQDWGQARILISADPSNEYFIALEKLPSGNYQIFSMSKANQTDWDVWELIAGENDNGTRYSIDFELVVIENTVYFLIDGSVVYTSNRVSMTESTVKFTGFNMGTTTVGNLSAQVFENQEEAESYLAQKVLVKDTSNVFYRNKLSTDGADPSAIYISEGVDAGSYYMYITSDALNTKGFLAYKSSDLVNWECMGAALSTFEQYDETTGITTVSYATADYWAPEVIYDSETKLYYLFYSATRQISGTTRFYADIAVSETPYGPFVPYNQYLGNEPVVLDETNKVVAYAPVFDFSNMDSRHPLYEADSNGYMKVIDMSPFVDPVSGQKYVYFCHDLAKELSINTSSVYVMALNDDYTPDYTEVYALTTANCLEVNGNTDTSLEEGKVNEAPCVVYNAQSQKYYLFYSAYSFYQQAYSTRVAVSSSPTGPFRKLTKDEGGWLLYAESDWTWASGTGHCSVVNRDGQDYVVYHAHKGYDENDTLIRGIAVDTLSWGENNDGLLVPVVSGPTITDTPLTTNSYQNIASSATVTATNVAQGTVETLTDGIISCHDCKFISDTVFNGSSATVTLQFDEAKTVWGIAVYNGNEPCFRNIQSIKLHLVGGGYVVYNNLINVWYAEDGAMIPGGSVALEFVSLNVTAIEIVMPATDGQYGITEITVMSKR